MLHHARPVRPSSSSVSLRPTLSRSRRSRSSTDICCERDACETVSHSFPWSLVLCWLCSRFPLRSGTPDDGRPRYELRSFIPSHFHCPPPPQLPLCLKMCVCASYSRGMLRLEASDMGCHFSYFTYCEWPHWYSFSRWLPFLFPFDPVFLKAHLELLPPTLLGSHLISLHSSLRFILIIHRYCTFLCSMVMWFKLRDLCITMIRTQCMVGENSPSEFLR